MTQPATIVYTEQEEQAPPLPFALTHPILKLAPPAFPSQNGVNGYGKVAPFILPQGPDLPDHTQLPESDGAIVNNFQELPQSIILTGSLKPVLDELHPDNQYLIGQDSGIYWDYTDSPLEGVKAPDWFYIPNRPPMLDGVLRRSYVMWKEITPPVIVIEYVSGDGSVEHDQTPRTGKFWVYENAIQSKYYLIYDSQHGGTLELYVLRDGHYVLIEANERNHYPVPEMGIELGLRTDTFMGMTFPWLRAWDADGNLLLHAEERAEQERQGKEAALNTLERYKAQLRTLGIDPERI